MADFAMEMGISAMSVGGWDRKAEEAGNTVYEAARAELKRIPRRVPLGKGPRNNKSSQLVAIVPPQGNAGRRF